MVPMLRVLVLGAALCGAALLTGTWTGLLAVLASCAIAALVDERYGALALIAGSLAALLHAAIGAGHPVLAGALWCAGVWSARGGARSGRPLPLRDRRALAARRRARGVDLVALRG
ncbi:MAG: hypothetical protein IPF99_41215 [Deltaproteobacteria bacterium]|nr:hypothetical protein [Deltaproteobacteria bacterium]